MLKILFALFFWASLSPQAKAGDATKGKALFENHRVSLCLLCHQEGSLAPSLKGIGARLTQEELKVRIVDMRKFNATSLMPSFHASEGLKNVSPRLINKPILTLEQIDDLVAYLKDY